MLSSRLNLSVTYTTSSSFPFTFPSQSPNHVVGSSRLRRGTVQLDSRVSHGLVFVSSFKGLELCRALNVGTPSAAASHVSEFRELHCSYFETEPSAKEIHLDNYVAKEKSDKDHRESQRRKKIGLANKGKVPWNKGKKHTAETRERIRQRTKEALKDPKVRKKMAECPRILSNQTKAKIRISIRRLWTERLRWKRSRERFIVSWAENIAKAAKKGGHGQQELDWDSYDKIQREISLQKLQWDDDLVKAKELAWLRAERLARARADKTLKQQMAKLKGPAKKRPQNKSKEEKQELAVIRDVKLKERLTKIHRKKSANGQLSSDNHRGWERLDLESMKKEARRKEVSLADQIRDVKNKKAEIVVGDFTL